MKKLFTLFLFILLLTSCRQRVTDSCDVSNLMDLTDAQIRLLETVDSTYYMDAIIVDDYVLVFEKEDGEIKKVYLVESFNIGKTVTFFILASAFLIIVFTLIGILLDD